MNIFLEETKPLTPKRRLGIWVMVFALTPVVAWMAGKHEAKVAVRHDTARVYSQPVSVALPAQLPASTWEF